MEVPALSQGAARARVSVEEPAEQEQPVIPPESEAIIEVDAAFLVYTVDGRVVIEPNINANIEAKREATTHDVIGMCAAAQTEATAMGTLPAMAENISEMTSDKVIQKQLMVGQQMAKAQQDQRLLQQLNGDQPVPAGLRRG